VGVSVSRTDDQRGKPKSSKKIWILGIFGCLGIVLMCVLVVSGATNFLIEQNNQMVISAKRTELKVNTNGIRLSQLAYYQQYGSYVECTPYPRHPGKATQQWETHQSGGFQVIDWAPYGDVRGSYSVSLSEEGFTVMGISDVDGDGVYATYIATKEQEAEKPQTPRDVY